MFPSRAADAYLDGLVRPLQLCIALTVNNRETAHVHRLRHADFPGLLRILQCLSVAVLAQVLVDLVHGLVKLFEHLVKVKALFIIVVKLDTFADLRQGILTFSHLESKNVNQRGEQSGRVAAGNPPVRTVSVSNGQEKPLIDSPQRRAC